MSPRNLRGAFVVMNQLALTSGTFFGQIIGVYIPYYWLAVIPLAFTLSFVVLSTTIKETPRWLMTQGRRYEAKKVLMWLRGPGYDTEQELQDIQERILSQKKLTILEIVQEFKNRSVYYPVILACFVMFFRQFSGAFAILFNAEDIFKQADVTSPGLTSSLATGGVQIIASIIGVFIADLFGRRKILIISGIMMCLSHGIMGVYEYLNSQPYCHPPDDSKCKDHLWPLAIVSIACYIANYTAGIGAIARLLLPELVPLRVRGIGIGISFFVSWSSTIFVAGLFDNYESAVRPWGAFWTLSFICFCSVIFTALFIPETKGKSLEEIERSLKENTTILICRSSA